MAGCGVKGLSHIGVIVSDMDRSIAFYQDALGFTLDKRETLDGGTRLAFLSAGTCIIELIQRAGGNVPAAPGPVDHICLDVEGIDDLVERLRAKGVVFLSDKVNTLSGGLAGFRNIFLTGPDGERLEFFEG
ncbi:MAG: VOC family protein [Oscillospiraceae bacterium]|jgi:lactoylglutathione lyase|nr:VOC family protein [Oscillospiraceae bacterium]